MKLSIVAALFSLVLIGCNNDAGELGKRFGIPDLAFSGLATDSSITETYNLLSAPTTRVFSFDGTPEPTYQASLRTLKAEVQYDFGIGGYTEVGTIKLEGTRSFTNMAMRVPLADRGSVANYRFILRDVNNNSDTVTATITIVNNP